MNRRLTNRAATQPRRGLDHDEAAVYVGVTFDTFDQLVAAGRLPRPVELSSVGNKPLIFSGQFIERGCALLHHQLVAGSYLFR